MKKAFLSAVLLSAVTALGADWPQFRGPARNGNVTDFKAPAAWPKDLKPIWKTGVGIGDSPVAVIGDKVYAFVRQDTDESTVCIDANSGKILWQDKFAPGVTVTGGPKDHGGPRSSPAVSDGKVVTLGVSGVLSCLDAESGKLVWRKETAKEFNPGWPQFYAASSPIIINGLAVAQLGGKGKGAVVAYDLATGDTKWKLDGDGPSYASLELMTLGDARLIVANTEKGIVGIDAASGKLAFQIPFAEAQMSYNSPSPVIDGQTLIYTGSNRGLSAVSIEKAGDAYTAKPLWANPDKISSQYSTPIVIDGLVYGLSAKGHYFCVDAKTGATKWGDTANTHNGFGSVVGVGKSVLGLTNKSELIAFEASDQKYSELMNIKVSDGMTYANLVVSGNRLFVKDQDSVIMFKVE